MENDDTYQCLDEDAYDMVALYTNSTELVERKNQNKEGDGVNMCQAIKEMLQDERAEGHAKNILFHFIIFLAISILAELLLFNAPAWLSRLGIATGVFSKEQELSFTIGEGLTPNTTNGQYCITDRNNAYIDCTNMEGNLGYLYTDIDCRMPDGSQIPFYIYIKLTDEGNSVEYSMPELKPYPALEKSRYFRIHCYGEPLTMRLYLYTNEAEAQFSINRIIYNAEVPCFFSPVRAGLIFL